MSQTLISIGKIVKPVGLNGKVKANLFSKGSRSLENADAVYLRKIKGDEKKYEVENISLKHAYVTLKLKGIESSEKAKKIVGFELLLDSKTLTTLGNNEFYHYELLGLDVYTVNGKYLGKLEKIFSTGSNDVFVVKKGKKELLIPFTEQVVEKIDIGKKSIRVRPLDGMIE